MLMHTVGRLVLSPHWLFVGTGALFLGLLIGCYAPVQEVSLETRAQALDKSLICPVCPGETIDQSQATLADQMQDIVREKLDAGWSDEQVRQYFVDRYGEGILAAPPKSGFNLLVWVVPPFGILGAILALALSVRAMRRGQPHSHYHASEGWQFRLGGVLGPGGRRALRHDCPEGRDEAPDAPRAYGGGVIACG